MRHPRPVPDEQVIHREEVVGLLFSVSDLLQEIRWIRRLLEDDGEVEEDLGE